jgi:hypothetical protein
MLAMSFLHQMTITILTSSVIHLPLSVVVQPLLRNHPLLSMKVHPRPFPPLLLGLLNSLVSDTERRRIRGLSQRLLSVIPLYHLMRFRGEGRMRERQTAFLISRRLPHQPLTVRKSPCRNFCALSSPR